MGNLRKVIDLLTPRERRQAFLLVFVAAIVSLLEVVGMISLIPFLAVLANQKLIETNPYLHGLYTFFGYTSHHSFLLFLAVASFVLIALSALVRSLGQYALIRSVQMRRHSIAVRLLETYLRQPYEFFLGRHSGDLGKGLLTEVDMVVNNILTPIQSLAAQGFTLVLIVGLLVYVNPWVAIIGGLIIGGGYALIYLTLRNYTARMGERRKIASTKAFRAAGEALGGIKSIKVMGHEGAYLHRFERLTYDAARYMSANSVLSQIPRYAIEAIALGGILLICVYLMTTSDGSEGGTLAKVLPLLGLYAFSGYRMLPAIQQVYLALTQLQFGAAALDELHKDMELRKVMTGTLDTGLERLPLQRELSLENVTYTYPASAAGVHDLSLNIRAGSSVGIVGSTGAGKTTLVDIVLGLLSARSGRLLADGVEITPANVRNWQANIGYVPQDIFLLDATIAANIAMGLSEDQIDMARVRECARMAQMDHFVEQSLPQGYATTIGERGVRLSGGQRQRIAIARALYSDPNVLVFDEATSALDNLTERQLMEAVDALHGTKTIIMIAHRFSTVKACDQIAVLEGGRLAGVGSYDELQSKNRTFQKIAAAEPAHQI